jgi:hypothetical protein
MFPSVESQVIFLSKETPIVSVGLRTAEVSYMNQNKTGVKIRSRTNAGLTTSHLCTERKLLDFQLVETFFENIKAFRSYDQFNTTT